MQDRYSCLGSLAFIFDILICDLFGQQGNSDPPVEVPKYLTPAKTSLAERWGEVSSPQTPSNRKSCDLM